MVALGKNVMMRSLTGVSSPKIIASALDAAELWIFIMPSINNVPFVSRGPVAVAISEALLKNKVAEESVNDSKFLKFPAGA